ncbi:unnamed protein product [Arabis nemorensis]|uniref:Uncharacterized protein n=1 Tax=Arabis nemorensis TaxID=586526 RepID=A0A565C7Y2_9BRAS|nr:unnamed protein product [Arabis nemorensis]
MMKNKSVINLVPFDEKERFLDEWYIDASYYGGMVGYYPIHGYDILLDTTMQIWDFIKHYFDREMKRMKVEKCQFPLIVGDGSSDKDILRKSMYPYFCQKVRFAKVLPLKFNQWYNAVTTTSELTNPIPFLRTREFLSQQGHSAFATREEAYAEVLHVLDIYRKIYETFWPSRF